MTSPGAWADRQWSRAVAAVTVALLVLYGVSRAGGPVAVAHEAAPVMHVAVVMACAATALWRGEGVAIPRHVALGR